MQLLSLNLVVSFFLTVSMLIGIMFTVNSVLKYLSAEADDNELRMALDVFWSTRRSGTRGQ